MKEAAGFLDSYVNGLENNPKRFAFLEERLNLISKLKRKYGNSLTEIEAYKEELQRKIDLYENLEERIESVKEKMSQAQHKTLLEARKITDKRSIAAKVLEEKITASLKELNMAEAEFKIIISEQPMNIHGLDHVEFYLKTNKGEPLLKVKNCSSGGELSRLMLTIKTTLAEKNNTSTLIFDEIDANVGGETATLMGEKLQDLAKFRQVFCITHFPQVASKADHNIRIYKQENAGRTVAYIEMLDEKTKEKELLRMLGGVKKPADPL